MSDLGNQKRVSASILKCGVNRVWLDPERMADIEAAISRDDLRGLIDEGAIRARPKKGNSRGRARVQMKKRAYGHRRGPGRRKGASGARDPRKRAWIRKIRALRRTLREMRDEQSIDRSLYRIMYRKAAGGQFRNIAHLRAQIDLQAGRAR
ncbi:MAG: 50S ribosomal protein L19e [Methanomicrobiaceae archaeon]|uniref:50S ribosomal protein L19e n=1 Tax=hydrocarbon metagenome TaxID=938273 RepID=A0A0W8FHP3_9ZZZZ|nr:50S ribosomal protein L19e [Methanomicrobiaceae archaeon]MDD5418295.1 50S ribosomal protein L19e [Methanomicrobiaceae archaeon]